MTEQNCSINNKEVKKCNCNCPPPFVQIEERYFFAQGYDNNIYMIPLFRKEEWFQAYRTILALVFKEHDVKDIEGHINSMLNWFSDYKVQNVFNITFEKPRTVKRGI